MGLTRNLYREDEVLAAIKWCCIKGRFNELFFWIQEALDSAMTAQALEALLWVWCFECGPSALGWLLRFRGCLQKGVSECSQEEILNMAASLALHCRRTPDSSAVALLGVGLMDGATQDQKEFLGNPVVPPLPEGVTPEEVAVVRAVLQGKGGFAWRLARGLWSDGRLWQCLRQTAQQKGALATMETVLGLLETPALWLREVTEPAHWIWPFRAVAVAALCEKIVIREEVDVPLPELFVDRENWRTRMMRYRRIHIPPQDCLLWFTRRGSVPVNETTEDELMSGLEAAMLNSVFWRPLLLESRTDDEARMYFYHYYFPTDIPDEWSSADRWISHGTGVIPAGTKVDMSILFKNCLNRWFLRTPSVAMWRGTETAINEFAQRWGSGSWPSSFEKGVADAYTDELLLEAKSRLGILRLEPVRREFIVS